MHKFINTVDIQRIVTHFDLEHEIYDEDYTKNVSWFFGMFKHRRIFKLTNDMSKLKDRNVHGFKNQ